MVQIRLRDIRKRYGAVDILHGIELDIADGEFVVFVGPSGCGKSTLLRLICGLEEVTGGALAFDGERVDHLMPAARGVSMVFQSYALYPHMTVYENMAFGLRVQGLHRREIDARIHAAADILNMRALLGRRPHQLSGGQAQRVAIGRAIVKQPRVFLFDEPLSNLDAELRVKMRVEISRLHKQLACTMIYVTHDQVEAMTMADKIVVMREGRIEQVGSPIELYTRPGSLFVAGFIGSPSMNFLTGRIETCGASGVEIRLSDGSLVSAAVRGDPGAEVTVGIRPEHLEPGASGIRAKVETVELLGIESLVHSHTATGEPLVISLRGIHDGLEGTGITVGPVNGQVHVFGAGGEALPRLEGTAGWLPPRPQSAVPQRQSH